VAGVCACLCLFWWLPVGVLVVVRVVVVGGLGVSWWVRAVSGVVGGVDGDGVDEW
jgi:hypothetical protein